MDSHVRMTVASADFHVFPTLYGLCAPQRVEKIP